MVKKSLTNRFLHYIMCTLYTKGENIMALVNKKNSNLRGFILGAQTMFEDSKVLDVTISGSINGKNYEYIFKFE